MNRPAMWGRIARRTVAAGAITAVLSAGAVSHGPALVSAYTPQQVAIPFVLAGVSTAAGGIVQSPATVGIADSDLYALSDADIETTLSKLAELGVTEIRVAVPWIYLEKTDDQYDWAKMDHVVQTANAKGMNVVGVITATPAWAGFPLNGHSDPNKYAEFAATVADRYDGVVDSDVHGEETHGRIAAYEIWNEPNGALFYNPVSAASYTAMLKAAAPVIRDADPDAVVIAGVLGSVVTVAGLSQNPVSFLREMYQSGAAGYFDALSFHPYNHTLPFSQGAGQANSPLNQMTALRALMEQYEGQDTDKRIWITEFGLPTNWPVTEQQQADFIRDFVVAWQSVEGAGPVFLYSTRDINSGGFDDEENFGLFRTNWDEKLAVQTLRDLYADFADDGQLTPFQAAVPKISDFQQLLMLGRQVLSFLLRFPKAIVEFAVSAITTLGRALADTVRSVLTPAGAVTATLTNSGADEPGPVVDDVEPARETKEFAVSTRDFARGSVALRRAEEPPSGAPVESAADVLAPQPEADVPPVQTRTDLRQLLKERRADLREQISQRRLQSARDQVKPTASAPGHDAGTADSTPPTEVSDTASDQGDSPESSTSDTGSSADPE